MNTAAFIDINTPLGASYIKVNGNLNLKQKSPIDRTTFYNEHYYENILYTSTSLTLKSTSFLSLKYFRYC